MNLAFWRRESPQRSVLPLSLDEYVSYFSYNGQLYPFGLNQSAPGRRQEEIGGDFRGLAQAAYKRNGVVFACSTVRMLLFSEARFQFRQLRSGRPGDMFGSPALGLLERPWANGTTGDLLSRAIQDVDLAGNWFGVRRPGPRIERLRPDWTVIVAASEREDAEIWDVDVEVLGYAYQPGGAGSGREPEYFLREQVAHFAPIPDPDARFRGMSWITPVIREIMADKAATDHKLEFFENGATPNLVVKLDPSVRQAAFEEWVGKFKAGHEGRGNQYKTLFLGGGADATPIGANLEQIDFKNVQGAGETRIAAAAGVPPVIVGLSEGLAAATYSNYSQARRRFADGTMRPLWRNMAASLSTIVEVPSGAELWYDDRDIPFLAEDVQDQATVQKEQATAMKMLVDAGYDAGSVVDAIVSGDMRRLTHSGLFSVQLQKPGQASGNGNGAAPDESLNV